VDWLNVQPTKKENIKMANQNPQNNLDDKARSKGGQNSPGNFKNDPDRAREAGKKGGQASSRGNNNR
jgi:general stress protein YciG